MPQDITLRQPVRLQIGGGIGPDGHKKPVQFVMLSAGLNRNQPDEVANHPYIKLQLAATPRPPAPHQMFSETQLKLLDSLGLSPQQRAVLDQAQLTPEQRAAALQPAKSETAKTDSASGPAADETDRSVSGNSSKKK